MKICEYDYFVNKIYDYDCGDDYNIFVIDYNYAIKITGSLVITYQVRFHILHFECQIVSVKPI